MRKNLKFEAKVWMHFINSRLIPGSHDTKVTWERVVLAFCIINRKKFHVGRIVSRQLATNIGRKSPFYFPCLVTELCKSAGLKPKSPELMEVIPLGANIDQGTLKRMRDNEGIEEEEETEKEEEEAEGEDKTKTVEGASDNIKQEEQQSAPKRQLWPQGWKITIGRRKTPEEGATSNVRGLSMWAKGEDAITLQIHNIEKMVAEELQQVKAASLLISDEKDKLEKELK